MSRTTATALQDRLTEEPAPFLVDVRSPAEFESSHVPGSVNVPLDGLRRRLPELQREAHGREVVLVCRSGGRASQAQQVLTDAGLAGTLVLTGGVAAWDAAGGPLNRGRQTWELERQVRLVAGTLVVLGVLGSVAVPGLKWLAAAVGAGLAFAALSNTCAMGNLLARMPWNRRAGAAA